MRFVRGILKLIFPPLLLKRAFLFYNAAKANTFDKLLFKKQNISCHQLIEFKEKNPFLELKIDTTVFRQDVKEKLAIWEKVDWKQDQYFICFDRSGFVEPDTGWGLSETNKLIYASLGFAYASYVHKPPYFRTRFKKEVKKLGKIISLRDTGEENYFHFFNDVFSKLIYAQEVGVVLEKYTIVISYKLFQKHYFQFFLKKDFFSSLNWYVQKSEWVHFEEAIFCKPFTHTKKYLDVAIDLAKVADGGGEKRVFLNRSVSSFRFIENLQELKPILSEFQFEIVDTAEMTMEQQITLFSQCKYLIAIHGAGITNILYRRDKPLFILEIIHPSPYLPFHYIMLSQLYNFNYNALLGVKGKSSGTGGFRIQPEELKTMISEMLVGK